MWLKQGLIYCPSGELWWARRYAYLPTVEVISQNRLRIYFASLDENKYGRIGFIDVDAEQPKNILFVSQEPILDLGEIGCFDDCGVNPSYILNASGKKYLYYVGWQKCERVPYKIFAGLAISEDGISFRRHSQLPILDRTENELCIRSATTILKENDQYKMWYVSAFKWITVKATLYPNYIIRYAESSDGIVWHNSPDVCIDFENENEFGFGRPYVIKENNLYKMWYSIRSKDEPYRIGYAESMDGIKWKRKDHEVGIEKSKMGWDSEMICFPCVVDVNGRRYMFYNGNGCGTSGFGYAVKE